MSSLPVPSKGALRALRHIAIGTSCTVAFATGVVAEDRRRRIHSAREVHDNAKRIKASRKYHSAGTSPATTFDEHDMSYGDYYGPWKVGNKPRSVEPMEADRFLDFDDARDIGKPEETPEPIAKQETAVRASPASVSDPGSKLFTGFRVASEFLKSKAIDPLETKGAPSRIVGVLDPQQELALKVTQLVGRGFDEQALTRAANEIRMSIEDGMELNVIGKPLQVACQSLMQACQQHDSLEIYTAVLGDMLTHGPIQEGSFCALGGISVMEHLLSTSGFRPFSKKAVEAEPIRRAANLFLGEYRAKPGLLQRDVLSLGRRLCTAARLACLDELSIAIFWRLNSVPGFSPRDNVADLIHAECHRNNWKSAQKHFIRFYTEIRQSQLPFYTMVGTLVDSTLEAKTVDGLVEILQAATKMAISLNLVTSTTWFLKYFQALWDTTGNFAEVEAIFNQLEPLFQRTSHPQAIYTEMIQICVTAGRESADIKYRDKLNGLTGPNLRSLGSLALARARKGDWEGVKEDLTAMKPMSSIDPERYAAVFTPILGVFIATHDISETEHFVRTSIQEHNVIPSQYLSNMVVNMYAKAGELDAITKWLDYVRPLGCKLDGVSLNSMLISCRSKWRMPLEQLLKLCHHMTAIDTSLINKDTLIILHRAATTDANGNANLAGRYRKQIEILRDSVQSPETTISCGNITNAMEEEYAKGNMFVVIKLFRQALQRKMYMKPEAVSMAVNASLKASSDGDIRNSVTLLKDAKARGLDVSAAMKPLLLFQIETLGSNAESVESMVNRIAPAIQKQGLQLPRAAVSKAMSILVSRGRFRQAVELWASLANDQPELSQNIDVVNLTVLLKAYIGLSDCSGIQWVISTLSRNDILPDARFKLLLKSALKDNRRRLNSNPHDRNSQRLAPVLDESIKFVLDRRSQGMSDRREAEAKTLRIIQSAANTKPGTDDNSAPRATVINQPVQSQPSITRRNVDVGRQKGRVKLAEAHRSLRPRSADTEVVYRGNFEEHIPHLAAAAAAG